MKRMVWLLSLTLLLGTAAAAAKPLTESEILHQAAKALAKGRTPVYQKWQAAKVKETFTKAFDRRGRVNKAWLAKFNRILKAAKASPLERPRQDKPWVLTARMQCKKTLIKLVEIRPDGTRPISFVGGIHVDY